MVAGRTITSMDTAGVPGPPGSAHPAPGGAVAAGRVDVLCPDDRARRPTLRDVGYGRVRSAFRGLVLSRCSITARASAS